MYYGHVYPFEVNAHIAIRLPTVGEIIEYDTRLYYSMVSTLVSIPSDMKSFLFDAGIDYEEISDFDLFIMLSRSYTEDNLKILFLDPTDNSPLDFSKFELLKNPNTNQIFIGNPEKDQIIDELAYLKIVNYLRKAHFLKTKVEKAANKTTKRILIDLDREDREKNKDKPQEDYLKNLISSMMRYPGFKYKSNELRECCIYEFMDTVMGSQIYIQSTALLQGSYSGMIDTSKINKKEFDWTRSVS